MTIRRASDEDLDSLLGLHAALSRYERDEGYDPTIDVEWSFSEEGRRELAGRISGALGVVFVAELVGTIVGYVAGSPRAAVFGRGGALESFYVDPACRRRGVGSALGRAFVEWCESTGNVPITVAVAPRNDAAIALYRKLGFVDSTLILERR